MFVRSVSVRWFAAWVLAVGLSTASLVAAQTPTPSLGQAQQALLQSQFATAQQLARAIEADFPVDSALIFARASLELGQLDSAMQAAELARTRAPNLAQARVMIALIHLRKGQPRRAMFALRRALDLAGSDVERAGIRDLLRKTQSGLALRFTGGIGFAPSSNVGNTASDRTFTDNAGRTVTYDPNAEVKSGVGLRSWAGAIYSVKPTPDQAFTFSGQLLRNDYGNATYDNKRDTASAQWSKSLGQGAKQIGFAYQFAKFRDPTLTSHSTTVSGFVLLPLDIAPVARSTRLVRLTVSRQMGKYPSGFLDFGANRVGVDYFRTGTQGRSWSIGVSVSDRNSGSVTVANRELALTGKYAQPVGKSGFRIGLEGRISAARWNNLEIGFSDRRWERDLAATIRVERPDTTFFGFTPYGELSYIDRSSNQTPQEFNSLDIFVGFKNGF